ncbi:NAD(P)H-dependent oxidoreductase [Neisseria sp. Ec49-e6-T10]|uniref:NAD(P)H-dependent oxidoreductase n=1 Tax=Neisseria sp. Ec49-e6-T10 TaxID=3140744 RepID=UPI003EBA3791
MKKILIIVTHPNIETSVVNKRWVEELKKYPEQFTVHELYQEYPDGQIDVTQEQKLIEQHENLILQFPIYWFNCPPLLKKWLDDVFTYGWAYGSSGKKLKNKKVSLAVSAGIEEEDFSENGLYQLTMKDVLKPFELTMRYVQADYQPFFILYGANNEPGAKHSTTPEKIHQSALDYIQFLSDFSNKA